MITNNQHCENNHTEPSTIPNEKTRRPIIICMITINMILTIASLYVSSLLSSLILSLVEVIVVVVAVVLFRPRRALA